MHITISGLPGSGTTTQAKLLSQTLGWLHWDTGALFRQWAKKRGMKPHKFGHLFCQNPKLDYKLDRAMLNFVKRSRKPLVIEGRLVGWLTKKNKIKALRVWLWAPERIRLARVERRDKLSAKEAWKEVFGREEEEIERYKRIYGIDLHDLSVYDMVIQNNKLKPTQVRDKILKKYSRILFESIPN